MRSMQASEPAPWWSAAIAAGGLFALAMPTVADPDLWGHVRFGLDLLSTGVLPAVDPYSFTQDQPWINHEWAAELQMGLAWTLLGPAGLVLLKAGLVWAAWLTVLRSWHRVAFGPALAAAAMLVVGTARLTMTVRPQIWSLLLFAVLGRALLADSPRTAWWLAGLFAVWANVHGGWILGLGVLGAWTVGAAIGRRTLAPGQAGLVIACTLATGLTPYGADLWWFIGDTVRLGRDITEWQPVWTTPMANWAVWAVSAAMSVVVVLGRGRDRWPSAVVLVMLACASWRVERLVPFFLLAAILLIAPVAAIRWPSRPLTPVTSAGDRALLAAIGVAGLTIVVGFSAPFARCIPVRGDWVPERDAVALFDDAPPGRLVTFFDWGQYAIWHWGPDIRVSMDGRRETVYSERSRSDHDAILRGTPAGIARLMEWSPEYVWLPMWARAAREALAAAGYQVVEFRASFVALRARDPVPPFEPAGFGKRPAGRCFPQ